MSYGYHDPPADWQETVRDHRHSEPSDKATLPGFLSTKVVGMTFVDGYPANVHRMCTEGCPGLVLVREPDNPHDPNAVAVAERDSTEGAIGHLPAALAGRIAPEIDAGQEWEIPMWEVLVSPGHVHNPGLSVTLNRRPSDG